MSEQDKAWLMEALSAEVMDEPAHITAIMGKLRMCNNTENVDEDEIMGLGDDLEDIVGQIDRAIDFLKLGKLADVAILLRSPHNCIREVVCRIVSTCSQNNPEFQKACIADDHAILQSITHLVVNDPSATVRLRALSALSCIIRSYEPAETLFLKQGDGSQVVVHALGFPALSSQDASLRHRCKALHLLHHLVSSSFETRDRVQQTDVLTALIGAVGGFHKDQGADYDLDSAETILNVFCALVRANPSVVAKLVSLGLPEAIAGRKQQLNSLGLDQSREELSLLDTLSQLLANPSTPAPSASTTTTTTPEASAAPSATSYSYSGELPGSHPPIFVPTNEFQPVLPGQSIPPGLHVRLNMTTGTREAKICDPTETADNMLVAMVQEGSSTTTITPSDTATQ